MSGALRKTMEYLGLSDTDPHAPREVEHYADDYDTAYGEHDDGYDTYERRAPAEVTPLRPEVAHHDIPDLEASSMSRITTIHPRTYNEAKEIGEAFRDNVPVIMNLSDMDDTDAKRLVDFAAGLVFGLHGSIERVTSKVFLLSPENVEVSTSGPEVAKATRGLFNQS